MPRKKKKEKSKGGAMNNIERIKGRNEQSMIKLVVQYLFISKYDISARSVRLFS